jgi:hypothetical protein
VRDSGDHWQRPHVGCGLFDEQAHQRKRHNPRHSRVPSPLEAAIGAANVASLVYAAAREQAREGMLNIVWVAGFQ